MSLKKFLSLMIVLMVAFTVALPTEAEACSGCHGGGGFVGGRPMYYGPYGRFPKLGFATPLRPWGGITPVRQFIWGRGRIRRVNRRMWRRGW